MATAVGLGSGALRPGGWGWLAALVLGVVACAPSTTVDNPVVTREFDDNSPTLDIPAQGVTLVLEGTCLALAEGPSGGSVTIVWPEGRTSWDAETEAVTMTRGEGEDLVATLGDQIQLRGETTDSTRNFSWATKPADDCPTQYLLTG